MREVQPSLPLGFGRLDWDHLPARAREEVLALWMRLLREHLERQGETAEAEGRA
jgi:hypothetical protein